MLVFLTETVLHNTPHLYILTYVTCIFNKGEHIIEYSRGQDTGDFSPARDSFLSSVPSLHDTSHLNPQPATKKKKKKQYYELHSDKFIKSRHWFNGTRRLCEENARMRVHFYLEVHYCFRPGSTALHLETEQSNWKQTADFLRLL